MKTTVLSLMALFSISTLTTSPFIQPAHAAKAKAEKATVLSLGTQGENMVYDKKKLSVKPGATVKLTFKNNAKTAGMQHNFVLAKPGTQAELATLGIQAGADKGWVPDSPNVLAHTKLLNAGESDTITFTAPATAGDYPYICTFPGHAATMNGILAVK